MDDDQTFADWYELTYPRIIAAVTLVTGDVHLSQDAVDEAFVRAYDRWRRVRGLASPAGWTYRVAVNVARRAGHKRTRERESWERWTYEPPVPAEQSRIWDLVVSLTERQREVIVLRYVFDLTEREVAETLRVTRGSVSRTLGMAHQRLRPILLDEELGKACDVIT